MRHFVRLLTVFLLIASTLSAWGQDPELLREEGGAVENPPESLQLECKFKVGDITKYDITITGEGMVKFPGQKEQVKLEARTSMRCARLVNKQLTSEGAWRVEWDTIRATMVIPEFGEMYITVPPIEYNLDKYGKVTRVKGLDQLAVCPGLPQQDVFAQVLAQLPSGGFPKKALKVGDAWDDLYEIVLPGQEPTKFQVHSTLLGFERILERDCAKILSSYEAPFTLDVGKLRQSAEETADDANTTEEKPVLMTGKEKGEFCCYFDYKEGLVAQVYGTVELMADEGPELKPSRPQEPSSDQPDESMKIEHDVHVKYTMVSLLFTGVADEEGEQKQ